MDRHTRLALTLGAALAIAGCGANYSPDTYAEKAVQQANKVDQGVVVGVRKVDISANSALGTATGAAAGGMGRACQCASIGSGVRGDPPLGAARSAAGGSGLRAAGGAATGFGEHAASAWAATQVSAARGW